MSESLTVPRSTLIEAIAVPRSTLIEAIAAACHEQNRMYCEQLMDHSQVPWSEAPENIRASAIDGVTGALEGATPEQSHENWCAFKVQDGWSYGEVKDVEKKTHPCLVPYGDLPEAQKKKDGFYVSMVQQLGLVLGLINEEST
jgi:hypothetical protein